MNAGLTHAADFVTAEGQQTGMVLNSEIVAVDLPVRFVAVTVINSLACAFVAPGRTVLTVTVRLQCFQIMCLLCATQQVLY